MFYIVSSALCNNMLITVYRKALTEKVKRQTNRKLQGPEENKETIFSNLCYNVGPSILVLLNLQHVFACQQPKDVKAHLLAGPERENICPEIEISGEPFSPPHYKKGSV